MELLEPISSMEKLQSDLEILEASLLAFHTSYIRFMEATERLCASVQALKKVVENKTERLSHD